MNRIIAALMALILIMTAISAAGCEAKEDPYKGYCTDGELAGGAALQNANAKSVTVSCEGDVVRIRLEFYVGSRMSGGSEEAVEIGAEEAAPPAALRASARSAAPGPPAASHTPH